MKKTYQFSSSSVNIYFKGNLTALQKIANGRHVVVLTDTNVYKKYKSHLKPYQVISFPAGEQHKTQQTVDHIIKQLIKLSADRNSLLIGVGGGVVTDIAGYVAGIFMRGISFGFVPTSLLAMVDAAIGGKNGIDIGLYKNMVGLTRQPGFILYDHTLLKTLPQKEWINGFAEIIKHACIFDPSLFKKLQQHHIDDYRKSEPELQKLIQKNATLKLKVVQEDEFEKHNRKVLNFGHTFGHAIENLYNIPHGHAISIGMGIACRISEKITGFGDTWKVTTLLKQYGLPPQFDFDKKQVLNIIKSDKKKAGGTIHIVLLEKIGKSIIHPIPFADLPALLK